MGTGGREAAWPRGATLGGKDTPALQPQAGSSPITHQGLAPAGHQHPSGQGSRRLDGARNVSPWGIIFPKKIMFPLCHIFLGLAQVNPSMMVPSRECSQGQQPAPTHPGQVTAQSQQLRVAFSALSSQAHAVPQHPGSAPAHLNILPSYPTAGRSPTFAQSLRGFGETLQFPCAWVKIHHDNTDA